ncbi:hypothetical protein DPMN_116312 [Dreissena polymorpha]|uniref:Uncharacterized protein n=1 Tax=Dreissena polymorpha TaxID=45954 RepID=A0A9D4KNL2_DREPO|nr:hypothetical protein DPMN_116312 [Dreissena polymorpha]
MDRNAQAKDMGDNDNPGKAWATRLLGGIDQYDNNALKQQEDNDNTGTKWARHFRYSDQSVEMPPDLDVIEKKLQQPTADQTIKSTNNNADMKSGSEWARQFIGIVPPDNTAKQREIDDDYNQHDTTNSPVRTQRANDDINIQSQSKQHSYRDPVHHDGQVHSGHSKQRRSPKQPSIVDRKTNPKGQEENGNPGTEWARQYTCNDKHLK